MKRYTYQFVKVPIPFQQRGIVRTTETGSAFEACKEVILREAENGWRLKQVVVPFRENQGVYGAYCYQVIFEREVDE